MGRVAGGVHTQEVDKVFIGPTRGIHCYPGLNDETTSSPPSLPFSFSESRNFNAIKFASAFPFRVYLLPFHSHGFPASDRMLPTKASFFSFFVGRDSSGIRPCGVIEGKLSLVYVSPLVSCRRDNRNKITITRQSRG